MMLSKKVPLFFDGDLFEMPLTWGRSSDAVG